jgi:hypothetical protein
MDAEHDESLVEEKENPFSFREKARMRGYKSSGFFRRVIFLLTSPGAFTERA